jgi:hypothetical protein
MKQPRRKTAGRPTVDGRKSHHVVRLSQETFERLNALAHHNRRSLVTECAIAIEERCAREGVPANVNGRPAT